MSSIIQFELLVRDSNLLELIVDGAKLSIFKLRGERPKRVERLPTDDALA